jgi:hypothetical protein
MRSELSTLIARARELDAYLEALTEDERNYLLDKLAPEPEPESQAPKLKKPAKSKRKIEKCAAEGCGMTRRALVHNDRDTVDYHEFVGQAVAGKTSQRRGMPSVGKSDIGQCNALLPNDKRCGRRKDHSVHDANNLDPLAHEYLAATAEKSNGAGVKADNYQRSSFCTGEIDGVDCHQPESSPIHDPRGEYLNYHPFVCVSPAQRAERKSSTSGDEANTGIDAEDVLHAVGGGD